MSKSAEFHINEERGTVRLTITERDRWGVSGKTQHTFNRHQFERALREAGITVPWSRVTA